jgi:hypothetical protein
MIAAIEMAFVHQHRSTPAETEPRMRRSRIAAGAARGLVTLKIVGALNGATEANDLGRPFRGFQLLSLLSPRVSPAATLDRRVRGCFQTLVTYAPSSPGDSHSSIRSFGGSGKKNDKINPNRNMLPMTTAAA